MKHEQPESKLTKGQYWQEHIESWKRSGLSQAEYCRLNSLRLKNFWYRKKQYNGKTSEQMYILRQKKSKPILADFRKWIEKKLLQVVPKSLLGTAVNYTFNQWSRLITYLDHGEVTPDNNAAENAIRPFVVGRKNWLFAGTQEGAEASACLYSLIETAKANNLDPYKYLRYLFEQLPFASSEDDYRALLPYNLGQTDLALENTVSGV